MNSACQDEIIVSLLCDLSIKFKAEKISVVVVVFFYLLMLKRILKNIATIVV